MNKKLFTIFALLFATSCSYIPGVMKEPKISVSSVGMENISFTQGTVIVNCQVDNPNSSSISLHSVDYKIAINSIIVGEGKKEEGLKVEANDKAMIAIPVTIQFKDIFKSIQTIFAKRELKYDFHGTAHTGIFSIPFAKDGTLDLKMTP